MEPHSGPLLTVKQAAKALGVHPATVYRWIHAEELAAIRYGTKPRKTAAKTSRGGAIRIPVEAVEAKKQGTSLGVGGHRPAIEGDFGPPPLDPAADVIPCHLNVTEGAVCRGQQSP